MEKSDVKAIAAFVKERQRQIQKEGWSTEHDDSHKDNSLAKAAACYAMPEDERKKYESYTFREPKRWFPRWWPKSWDVEHWKPTPENRKREIEKAGALLLAEWERLDRLEAGGV